MKDFKKLNRDEMKNVRGGTDYPACLTGRACYTVPNGVCSGSSGIYCYCTSKTNPGVQSIDPNCSGQNP
jgi:hypothetical protein